MKLTEKYRAPLLLHLLAWTVFISYETGGIYLAAGRLGHFIFYLLFYPLNMCLFYLNAWRVLPYLTAKSRRAACGYALLLVPAELLAYLGIKVAIDYLCAHFLFTDTPFSLSRRYLVYNLWRGLYFFGLSTIYWSALRLSRLREQAAEAEKRQLGFLVERARLQQSLAELDNAYLRQQINPHFLFNALNFIYNSFYKLSAPAAACVSNLADILRYSFDQTGQDGKASLQAEIGQIKKLIELNRLRFGFPLYLRLEVSGAISEQRIPPLILLSFTENMFKYGNLKEKGRPGELTIAVSPANQLRFTTGNQKKHQASAQKRGSIGLSNTIKRLDYAYPGNYELVIRDEQDHFGIELTVNL